MPPHAAVTPGIDAYGRGDKRVFGRARRSCDESRECPDFAVIGVGSPNRFVSAIPVRLRCGRQRHGGGPTSRQADSERPPFDVTYRTRIARARSECPPGRSERAEPSRRPRGADRASHGCASPARTNEPARAARGRRVESRSRCAGSAPGGAYRTPGGDGGPRVGREVALARALAEQDGERARAGRSSARARAALPLPPTAVTSAPRAWAICTA